MASSGTSGSSSSNNSRGVWRGTRPLCGHRFETDVLTSHTKKNPGRRFFCCSLRKWDDCDFFQWVDWLAQSHYQHFRCMRELRAEMDKYEILLELKCAEIDMLTNQLDMKAKECEEMKLKLADASAEAQMMKKVVIVVCFIASVACFFRNV